MFYRLGERNEVCYDPSPFPMKLLAASYRWPHSTYPLAKKPTGIRAG
jgi:hypothetical protein